MKRKLPAIRAPLPNAEQVKVDAVYPVSQMSIHEHDIVELMRDVDGWPAGTVGAVISTYPRAALVEIEDPDTERELLEDLVSVPHEALRVIRPTVQAGV